MLLRVIEHFIGKMLIVNLLIAVLIIHITLIPVLWIISSSGVKLIKIVEFIKLILVHLHLEKQLCLYLWICPSTINGFLRGDDYVRLNDVLLLFRLILNCLNDVQVLLANLVLTLPSSFSILKSSLLSVIRYW